jgi:hypothetical protein
MADKRMLRHVTERTCAVCVAEKPYEELAQDPYQRGMKIIGTGFLVHPQVIMTNRHVIRDVNQFVSNTNLPKERVCVSFLRPQAQNSAQFQVVFVQAMMPIETPQEIDIGFLVLVGPMREPTPVEFEEFFSAEVGDECAVAGYPYGEGLHRRPSGAVYRIGPVLQRGHVSAIAPYDNTARIDRVLLDVRTDKGMSGSPIFDPNTGRVFAIHDSGTEAEKKSVVAFGVPLSRPVVDDYISAALRADGPGKIETVFVKRRPSPEDAAG